MNIKCPNCGAVHSLDSLIGNDGAAELVKAVLEFDAAVGKAAVRYIGLFRPAKSQLTFSRTAKLLGELLPDIQAGQISRDGTACPAPAEAWLYGFQTALNARDAGRLKTPLKSHGYLYEIISHWRPSETADMPTTQPTAADTAGSTKLRQGVNALSQWAGEDWLKQEIAAGFAVLAAMNLKGRPAAQDLAVVAGLWVQRLESREEKPVEQFDRIRFQTAFKALHDVTQWPNVVDLIRNLPPRLIPRAMLEKPKPDRVKGREEIAKVKQSLNVKKGNENGNNQ